MTRWLVGVLLCSLALVGTACGSGSGSRSDTGSKSDTAAAERAAAKREAQAEYAKCQSQVGNLIKTESNLSSHLDVGLNYNEYTHSVGDVKAAYDSVPNDSLDIKCLPAGVAAENALNQYTKAATVWDSCFEDINCSNDSIDPTLQKRWAKASTYIERAKSAVDDIKNETA